MGKYASTASGTTKISLSIDDERIPYSYKMRLREHRHRQAGLAGHSVVRIRVTNRISARSVDVG